ncbi:CBS domain-containing protein [Paenibacillus sp. HN-1]|uniref:CBS domain-containing protein n=1 Tax=Paenibacillus TaxID=44249 RepID=UPI001CA7FF64|nr:MULTISPECIES: CBS domain-containing protein [Paenibacillus]MBY9077563.1 CBS domain-containing protein [Paenibacillus sp. CGMCC 1.18879]MBY9087834.1 CBS domain-containing protein [Paenibacillus sinensis]
MTIAQAVSLPRGVTTLLRPAPVLREQQTCREAIRLMFEHPRSKCLVICDESDRPVGLLMSEPFFLRATGRSGADSFYRESALEQAQTHLLTADIESDPSEILARLLERHPAQQNDSIIITRNGKLAGTVNPADLRALLG